MNLHYTPAHELYNRIAKFQQQLSQADIAGALIVQKADLFYLSGTCQNAHLFVPSQGNPLLMVKKSLSRAQKESAIEDIVPLESLKEVGKNIMSRIDKKGKIGLEMDVLPANLYLKYTQLLSPIAIVDISKILRSIRMIKSSYEIQRLKETAKLNHEMFSRISSILTEGITEVKLAAALESIYRENGHQGAIRMRGFNQEIHYGHLMSGWNLAYPSFFDGPTGGTGLNPSYPQSAGLKKINRNEPVMVDYVGAYQGYLVDQARIFSIGPLPDHLVDAHETALKIKSRISTEAAPGKNVKELYELAFNLALESGYADHFMGDEYKINFIGHGVGIELDEMPIISKKFDLAIQPGMVFALEPKFVFRDEGTVGIEDTFVVTEKGLEQISYFNEEIQVL